MKYTTINIQGNLISEEILRKVEDGSAAGQQARDFGLESSAQLRNEIEYAWSRVKLDWKHFSERMQNLPENDQYGTTLTRRWMDNFFSSLGFDLNQKRISLTGDNNQSYAISHTAGALDDLPVHIVGFYNPESPDRNTLDIKSSGGASRLSPHGTMQEYLNVTEHLYGMVTNGISLRLMRDSGRLIKLVYVEFDLRRMLEEDKYSEFTILFRLLHNTRFPKNKQESEGCVLEKYFRESIESGNRIRNGLSKAVEISLVALGTGLLQHEKNIELRTLIREKKITPKDFYRQLLRLIYRLLFLMVTEERDLIYDPDDKLPDIAKKRKLYFDFYSIARLRRLCRLKYLYESQYTDLWRGLMTTLRLFEENGGGTKLGIQPLAGELFSSSSIKDISGYLLSNELLLQAICNLNEFTDENGNLVSINYRSLDVEELGSVYEGLLELHPIIENIESENPNQISFLFHSGTDRKTTGSYYTRPDLVNELIKSALIPVIKERLKENSGNRQAQEKALLSLKVCDPACGSGHMVLAAARTIAWELACVRTSESNPAPSVYRSCLREVIQHCVYAVDMNPDAVELCKLSLWLESHNSGKPISFLDHKIRCGNSLVGVTDLSVLKKGIPNNAFNAVTGDNKEVCSELKKANAKFLKTGQFSLFDGNGEEEIKHLSTEYSELDKIRQDDLGSVKKIQTRFEHFRRNAKWLNDWTACNIWTSAFFYTYTAETKTSAPSTERLQVFLQRPAAAYGPMVGKANAIALENRFFHWPLEFPDVFAKGGFDVMLGNPPWEIVELNSKEFFQTKNKKIADAESDKKRRILIENLLVEDIELYHEYYSAKHTSDTQRKFIQESNRFPESSIGRIDLYPLFVENALSLISDLGMVGLIVPSDIATGAYNANLFSKIINEQRLKCFFDFENSKGIFPDVHKSKRFCVLSLAGEKIKPLTIDLFYFGHEMNDLQNKKRRIILNFDELSFYSPNTLAPPIFHNSKDYSIAKRIYTKHGIFINKKNGLNPWGASINRMLSLSDKGVDFKKNFELSFEDKHRYSRLYSGKNIFQYNHRFATYTNKDIIDSTLDNLTNPRYSIESENYVPYNELEQRIKNKKPYRWLIGYRDVTNSTNERTCISAIIPKTACDTNCRNVYSDSSVTYLTCLLGNFNSIVFDYFVRQKVLGSHLNAGTFEQLPVLFPDYFSKNELISIIPKITELSFTAWDIKAFADELWKDSSIEIKMVIKNQWEENKIAKGCHEWDPPDWCEMDPEGCPLPPFKWDEDRRAVLKAELDAIYAKLYGLTTDELRYILDPQDVYGPDFPGETFRVLKEKEMRLYGEYRTKRLVMEAWERMNE